MIWLSRVIKYFRTEENEEYILSPFTVISEIVSDKPDTLVSDNDDGSAPCEPVLENAPANVMEIAARQAAEIVADAKNTAKKIIDEAKQAADALKENAEKTAYEKGYKAGSEQGRLQFAGLLQKAEAVATQGQADSKRFFDEAEESIFAIALGIAEQVISHSIQTDNQTVVSIAKRLLDKARNGKRFVLKCNPLDIPTLSESSDALSKVAGGKAVELEDDRNMAQGGCRLETDYGVLDGTIESQLEQLRRLIEDLLDGN